MLRIMEVSLKRVMSSQKTKILQMKQYGIMELPTGLRAGTTGSQILITYARGGQMQKLLLQLRVSNIKYKLEELVE